jgi:phospholipid-binding lipoprotein MlaA
VSYSEYRVKAVVLVLLCLALSLVGCAATHTGKLFNAEVPAMHSVGEFSDDERLIDVPDPWERFNHVMYNFNYRFDKDVFLPVVSGYEHITPVFAQQGISNFFCNISEFRTFYNSLLQMKGKKSLITFGRFVTNTTIGIGGFFDPASSLGLKKQGEDFGRTLGNWGVQSGPYLVLPVLGPNTLRSTGGFAADAGIRFAAVNAIDPFEHVGNGNLILSGITVLESIDLRHRQKFRYYESGSPFEYELVRFLYVKRSELMLKK